MPNFTINRFREPEIYKDKPLIISDYDIVAIHISMGHFIHVFHVEKSNAYLFAYVLLQFFARYNIKALCLDEEIDQRSFWQKRENYVAEVTREFFRK